MRVRFFPLIFSVMYAFPLAGTAVEIPSVQKISSKAKKSTPKKEDSPTVITADKVFAKQGQELEAIGHAELRNDGQSIRADHVRFLQESNEVFAEGAVRVEHEGGVMTGPSFQMNLDTETGTMEQPQFSFTETNLRGSASVMHIEGKHNYRLKKATYTSCPAGNDDWLLRMGELELDRDTETGTGYNTRVEFLGVPILYTPWMNFPLNDKRRSGFLAPIYSNTNTGGFEFTAPLYWNIAPNYDATFSPRVIQKRGTLLKNEFRYLGSNHSGKVEYDRITNDRIAKLDRSRASLVHAQNFGNGFSGSINLNQVSDEAYLRDLSTIQALAVQRQLLREGALAYTGGWWNASLRTQLYQTLQDPAALITPTYRRLPQFNVGAQRVLGGAVLNVNSEYVDFDHPTLVNGKRTVLYPSVAYPLVNDPGYYLTPKIGVHSTRYALGLFNTLPQTNYERTLPILSVDSGMTLERDFTAFAHDYVQTLEPRLFYVNIPYREQAALPIFDTAPAPFSFSQIFTENRFLGSDRIGDANQLTAALTSRFLDAGNGFEKLRFTVAQRFSREPPKVTLGAPTATTNQSDVLFSVTGRLTRTSFVDSLVQYNPNASRLEVFTASTRYNPQPGRVFNLGYRYSFVAAPSLTNPQVEQVEASAQWQAYGRWNIFAQTKYSIEDRRSVESTAGLEYNQSCWTLRMGAQQYVTTAQEVRQSIIFQLELKELLSVGSNNVLTELKRIIPGYSKTEEPAGSSAH
jgi:LPS-assembly protein